MQKNPAIKAPKYPKSNLPTIIATAVLKTSPKKVNAAAFLPYVLYILVAPAFPLPDSLMSLPYLSFEIITPKFTLPKRYDNNAHPKKASPR